MLLKKRRSGRESRKSREVALNRWWNGYWVWVVGLAVLGGMAYFVALQWMLRKPTAAFETHRLEYWTPESGPFLSRHSRLVSVPFERVRSDDGKTLLTMELSAWPGWKSRFSQATRIGFYLDLHAPTGPGGSLDGWARIRTAELSSEGRVTSFKIDGPANLENGDLLELVRVGKSGMDEAIPARWQLVVEADAPGLVALRCHVITTESFEAVKEPALGIFARTVEWQTGQPTNVVNVCIPHGRFTTHDSTTASSRHDVLTALGRFSGGLTTWLSVAAVLLAVGIGVFPWVEPALPRPEILAVRTAVGVSCLWLAFGLGNAVLTPVMSGADEPETLRGYDSEISDPSGPGGVAALDSQSGIQRRRFHPEQKLTMQDLAGRPEPGIEMAAAELRPETRSAVGRVAWRMTSWIGGEASAAEYLFRRRLLSLLVTALGVAVLSAMAAIGRPDEGHTGWGAVLLLLVPCLPWWGMNFSGHPFVLFSGMILAGSIGLLLQRVRVPWWLGGVYGLGLGLLLHSAGGMMPAAAFSSVLLLAQPLRALLPATIKDARPAAQIVGFWGLLGIGVCLPRLISNSLFDLRQAELLSEFTQRIHQPWLAALPLPVVVFIAVCLLALLELGAHSFGQSNGGGGTFGALISRLTPWAWLAAFAVGVALVSSILMPVGFVTSGSIAWPPSAMVPGSGVVPPLLPALATLREDRPGAAVVREVVGATFRSLGPGDRDFLTVGSFWNGVGYPDVLLPGWLISPLIIFFMVGYALLWWRCSRTTHTHRLIQLTLLTLALVVWVALVAAEVHLSGGRLILDAGILLPFHLVLLAVGAHGWVPSLLGWQKRNPASLAFLLISAVLTVHLVAASQLLARHFE